ncbi:Uncharacterised protein [uncultured archaeon]|nr:Uncharacterised protein [uncultured archaeon]
MIREENFVDDLNCDELCVLSKKKRLGGKLSDKKMTRLAVDKMNANLCEC